MELCRIDPRLLKDNPNNPRRTKASREEDVALGASIAAVGILEPPTYFERDSTLYIKYGHRRRDGAIAAGLAEIEAFYRDEDTENDGVRALAENQIRAALNPIDEWIAVEKLINDKWTKDAIARAMLEQMRQNDMPSEHQRTFRLPKPEPKQSRSKKTANANHGTTAAPSRPPVTQKGQAMLGDLRTDALRQALREAPADCETLLGLMVLAFGASNVDVTGASTNRWTERGARRGIAASLVDGNQLTVDALAIIKAARTMLASVLSCRENPSKSGPLAIIAGHTLGADHYLPTFATEAFVAWPLPRAGGTGSQRRRSARLPPTERYPAGLARSLSGGALHPANRALHSERS